MTASSQLFVTGMFRSGTTLIARMLATHPALAFASDPYAPLFKALRNAVAACVPSTAFDGEAPLDDYYFDASRVALLDATRAADLATIAAPDNLLSLRERIARHSQAYSPKVAPLIGQLEGTNFAELFEAGFRIVERAYGGGDEEVVGIKEVWAGEFVWPLLAGFPDAKAILVVRDPRAVAASKNVRAEKYPWLFLARQWRKLAALAWLAESDERFAGRIHLVRYEDLVNDPEQGVRNLCDATGVAYKERLTRPSEYRDGDGTAWFQNSSHYTNVQDFNPASVGRWRDVLSTEEATFVEAICWPEMLLFGYTLEHFEPNEPDPGPFEQPPLVKQDDLAAWICPYSISDVQRAREDMVSERRRGDLLTDRAQPADGELRLHLLDPQLYQPLKKAIDHGLH